MTDTTKLIDLNIDINKNVDNSVLPKIYSNKQGNDVNLEPKRKKQKNKKSKKPRCNFKDCNKKLDFMDITVGKCKCELIFCSKHRNKGIHICSFNWKNYHQQNLKSQLNKGKSTDSRRLDVI